MALEKSTWSQREDRVQFRGSWLHRADSNTLFHLDSAWRGDKLHGVPVNGREEGRTTWRQERNQRFG